MGKRARALTFVAALTAALITPAPPQASAVEFAVSGTVRANGAPLAGVIVYAYEGGDGATCCTPVSGAVTGADGTYSISLEPGSYRVRFYPNTPGLVEEWWDAAPDFASGADVVVGAANVPGIDATLIQGFTITGTITLVGGGPLEGVGVHAMDGSQECCVWVTGTDTEADGTYALTVPNGTYRLYIYSSGIELSEWYAAEGGAASFEEADDITIEGGGRTGVNAALVEAGRTIRGTVTDDSGAPMPFVYVHAFDGSAPCCVWVTGAETDANGEFVLAVAEGEYILLFYPPSGVMKWWPDAANFESATPIDVTTASQEGFIAELEGGSTISGTVTGLNDEPLENVFVGAFDALSVCCSWIAGAATDANGKFRLEVPDGTYRLQFYPWDGAHIGEWWAGEGDGAESFELAVDINVLGDDVTVGGVPTDDFDGELSAGVTISGSVEDEDGDPMPWIYVGAYNADAGVCCEWIAGTGTDEKGEYVLTVPNGNYKLLFYPWDGSAPEWWQNAFDFESATKVQVQNDENEVLRPAVLGGGNAIVGTVVDGNGDPVPNAFAMAFRVDEFGLMWAGGAVTDFDGEFSIVVSPGDYKVQVFGPDGFLWQWYDGEAGTQDEGSAQAVIVAEGEDPDPLEPIVLSGGDPISGTVYDETGEPLPGVDVLVFANDCQSFVSWTSTDGLGNYTATVGAGEYYVWFIHYGGYASEWYDDSPNCANATTVTGGDEDIDGTLSATDAAITGTVQDNDTSEPIAGVTVTAYDLEGNQVGQDITDINGEYSISVLDGAYMLSFSKTGYVTSYLGGHLTLALSVAHGYSVSPGDQRSDRLRSDAFTGTIRDDATNQAIVGATVTAYDQRDTGESDPVGTDTTDENGQYSIALPAGRYVLKVSATAHVTEYTDDCGDGNHFTFDQANCGGALHPGWGPLDVWLYSDAFTGTIRDDATNQAIVGAIVTAYVESDTGESDPVGTDTTDENGQYSIALPAGRYVLKVSATAHVTEYTDDCGDGNHFTFDQANCGGALHPGWGPLDVWLYSDAFTGTIRDDATNQAIVGAIVTAYVESDTGESDPVGTDTTDGNGQYSIALPAGRYVLKVSATAHVTEYTDDCGDGNHFTFDQANCGGALHPGWGPLDVWLYSDALSGTVYDETAQALAAATVTLYDASDATESDALGSDTTDGNGQYSIALPAGRYMTKVVSADGLTTLYGTCGATTFNAALTNCGEIRHPGSNPVDLLR